MHMLIFTQCLTCKYSEKFTCILLTIVRKTTIQIIKNTVFHLLQFLWAGTANSSSQLSSLMYSTQSSVCLTFMELPGVVTLVKWTPAKAGQDKRRGCEVEMQGHSCDRALCCSCFCTSLASPSFIIGLFKDLRIPKNLYPYETRSYNRADSYSC